MFSAADYSWFGAGTALPGFASRGVHKALIEARMKQRCIFKLAARPDQGLTAQCAERLR